MASQVRRSHCGSTLTIAPSLVQRGVLRVSDHVHQLGGRNMAVVDRNLAGVRDAEHALLVKQVDVLSPPPIPRRIPRQRSIGYGWVGIREGETDAGMASD